MREVYGVGENLLASQEGLCSIELVVVSGDSTGDLSNTTKNVRLNF
jgi:hypothetical protein